MPKARGRRERTAMARLTESSSPGTKQADGGEEKHWVPQGQGGVKPSPGPSPPHPGLRGSFLVMLGNLQSHLCVGGKRFPEH